MDLNLLRKLVRLMDRGDLTELEIEDKNEGFKVHLRRAGEPTMSSPTVQVLGGGGVPAAPMAMAGALGQPDLGLAAVNDGPPPGTVEFASPMVGTFYRAASPEAGSFAEIGMKVTEDSVLCIVEAMKVMNEIKAEMTGEVVECLVENGDPVEFGQALFLIKKG
ncbi:MAG: acetyl-CoA carboxylase biotin carboxyl carrier protein [Bacteroidia bacterium]|jgi:acetyl-CoA carboxylase biotin carboxyl carrier protein